MERFTSVVNGERLSPRGEGHRILSPSDYGDEVGFWYEADAASAAAAVDVARAAFASWGRLSGPERGQHLYQAATVLASQREVVARLASREMGKPIGEMRGEVDRGAALLRYYAGEAVRPVGDVIPSAAPGALLFTERRGVGPALLITPWNFPVAIPIWKLAPAVAYGNTVVWKPAEHGSATASLLMDILDEAEFPPGVVNLILGTGARIGPVLTAMAGFRAISFTGSRPVGMEVARAAVAIGARVQLEMGGKNPAIVLEDADIEAATDRILSSGFRSAGQKCTATSRVIAVGAVGAALVEALKAGIERIHQGPALDESAYLGPVVSPRQQKAILEKIHRGVLEGARVLVGPDPADALPDGAYVAPTLVQQLEPTGVFHAEEIFGPVIAVFPARSADDAISMANQVPYGLSASLFTRDLDRALYYIRGIEAGLVRVNEESAGVEYQAPFGGTKDSSYGPREQGRAAIEFYTESRTITIRPSK